jgi:hypothetical protein
MNNKRQLDETLVEAIIDVGSDGESQELSEKSWHY